MALLASYANKKNNQGAYGQNKDFIQMLVQNEMD